MTDMFDRFRVGVVDETTVVEVIGIGVIGVPKEKGVEDREDETEDNEVAKETFGLVRDVIEGFDDSTALVIEG